MGALEKEYNELSQRDVDNTVADNIQNLLSDLVYEEDNIQNDDPLNIEKPKVSINNSFCSWLEKTGNQTNPESTVYRKSREKDSPKESAKEVITLVC